MRLLVFFSLALIFSFGVNTILEPDAFYHMGHATVYREQGIFTSAFPWTQFSVWKNYAADIWYGFHFLLLPFALFADSTLSIKIAAAIFTTLALYIIYKVFKRHSFNYPVFWTLLIYFATPNFLLRFNMLRPNTLTIALLMLLFSFLIKPMQPRRWWLTAIIAGAITFLHLTFFWAAILVAIAALGARWIIEKRLEWRQLLGVGAGLALGWLMRPNPIGALKILKVQLFDLALAKQQGIFLLAGDELRPLDFATIAAQLIPMLIIWLIAIAIWIRRPKLVDLGSRAAILSSALLSLVFLVLAFAMGRRALDFWVIFAVFLAAQVFTGKPRSLLVGVAAIFIFAAIYHSTIFFTTYAKEAPGGPDQLRTASLWLKNHAQPGEIVFHTSWDSFPMLFFWNSQNYYINGADPIFEYAYDPKIYWENHFIAIGGKPFTCYAVPCTVKVVKPLYDAIKNDFRASYVILELSRNAGLNANLEKDRRFEKVFSTDQEIIYKAL